MENRRLMLSPIESLEYVKTFCLGLQTISAAKLWLVEWRIGGQGETCVCELGREWGGTAGIFIVSIDSVYNP